MTTSIKAGEPAFAFEVRGMSPVPVLAVTPAGRLFWHGREVETDDELRAVLWELARYLKIEVRP